MHGSKLIKICCGLTLTCVSVTTFANLTSHPLISNGSAEVHGTVLYLQPHSSNLKYAVFVSGMQPYLQSWHYQTINPAYSPAFELGASYQLPQSNYSFSVNWLNLNTNDARAVQAATTTDPLTVQFVAPAYDVGPAVFGIKHAASSVNFNFNSIDLDVNRVFNHGSGLQAKVFGGINVLRIHQYITTTFSDYAGTPPTTLTYGLPADPSYNFQTQNGSQYLGAGPEFGFNLQFKESHGFGVVGQLLGAITAGTTSVQDNFTSTSQRLTAVGIPISHQQITAPDVTEIVPGVDGRLGLFYSYNWPNSFDLSVEAGYRFAYYVNGISDINPLTLVQPGFSFPTPEFATGTMAIESTTSTTNRPFSFNGPYLMFTLGIA